MPITRNLITLAVALLFLSCASKKKTVYFQGERDVIASGTNNFATNLMADDLLDITVMGLDAEAVKPFNLLTYGQSNLSGMNSVIGSNGLTGYLIDTNGDIEFPIIGKIKLTGMSRAQAAELIKGRLKDYLKDPIVNIRILNYKFTILGDIARPGTYNIPNERITLIEAIGMAGDLNLSGLRKNILVIRDKDGKKTETRVDLTSKDIFNSPVFYLQQNDVIYVEPNRPKRNSSAVNSTGLNLVISISTLLVTLTTLLIR
jgi:polysaccharide export outer membrane protein